jgi:hypothetical protein
VSALRSREKAVASCKLAAPQPFPLTGDGPEMEYVWNRQSHMVLVDRCDLPVAIVEARYRDWLRERGK